MPYTGGEQIAPHCRHGGGYSEPPDGPVQTPGLRLVGWDGRGLSPTGSTENPMISTHKDPCRLWTWFERWGWLVAVSVLEIGMLALTCAIK